MKNVTITANHPARKRISDLPNYFDSKGAAVQAIDMILADYDMGLACFHCSGDEGSVTVDFYPVDNGKMLCDCCEARIKVTGYNNLLSFSWYRMGSGKWEIVAYIS